jgi:hypothetical protein
MTNKLSRKIITRSGRGIRGWFPSIKLGRMVAWESLLERDAICLMEFSPAVLRYQEQPPYTTYSHQRTTRKYFPDIKLKLANHQCAYIEVKPAEKFDDLEIEEKYSAIAAHFAKQDIGFYVLTEREIRQEPRFSNLKLLAYHAGRLHTSIAKVNVERLKRHGTEITLSEAITILGDERDVYRLLASGYCHCDLHSPLTYNTKIQTHAKGADDVSFPF